MELGSVKFFRRLISLIVLFLLAGLLLGILYFAYELHRMEAREDLDLVLLQARLLEYEQATGAVSAQDSEDPDYQNLYPALYAAPAQNYDSAEKVVYLTFDGGPSPRTAEILAILAQNDIKATFFVRGGETEEEKALLRQTAEGGHALGVYSCGDAYAALYKSPEAYLEDFEKQYGLIFEATGVLADIFRFPGGSINKYNRLTGKLISAELVRRGFTYYDWNASGGDTAPSATADDIVRNAVESGTGKPRIFLLLHDGEAQTDTPDALQGIIDYYTENGYTFDRITNRVKPVAID